MVISSLVNVKLLITNLKFLIRDLKVVIDSYLKNYIFIIKMNEENNNSEQITKEPATALKIKDPKRVKREKNS